MKEFRKIPSLKFMYEVSATGVVRNVKSKKVLSQRTTPNSSYLYIHTMIGSTTIDRMVHRLVAECWVPVPKKYLEAGMTIDDLVVNHLDFDITNNSSDNLEWCTQEENLQYSIDAGHLDGSSLKEYYNDHPAYWKGKHLTDNAKEKLSEARKCKKRIKAVDIASKEKFEFDSLDDAVHYIEKKFNKNNSCIRSQILKGCKGERKVVYKHNWYFI